MKSKNKIELNVFNNKVTFKRFVIKDMEIIKPMTNSHLIGVRSEYKYIKQLYPNSKLLKQRVKYMKLTNKRIDYDILTIKTSDNQTKDIYFDTSKFFNMRGKDKGKPQIWVLEYIHNAPE
jgi:phage antirepressor YoqD-like protein